jgi:predicted amidophosphoribosyltransferase
VPAVSRGVACARAAALRTLRRADGVARPALQRVRRTAARVRHGACRRRVRRIRPRPHRRRKERGLRRLADDAAEIVSERLPHPGSAVVTFVPPDAARRLVRGYHPAERLAAALAARWSLPCEALLARSGRSLRQRGLSLPERRQNVAGAFRARAAPHSRVVLVDDVYTSGATVGAAASALRAAGSGHIEVITFARAIRGSPPVR